MKKTKIKLLAALIVSISILSQLIFQVSAAVIPGGMPFGVRLCCDGVLIVGVDEFETSEGMRSPARDAGIKVRDLILEVNGERVERAEEVSKAVSDSDGAVAFRIRRGEEELELEVIPELSLEGTPRAGLWVRDSAAGIGTVTYIDAVTGEFGGLGHGICDPETGGLMPIKRGVVTKARINGVKKGESGLPGELIGSLLPGKSGTLLANTECGVFGVLCELPAEVSDAVGVETAEPDEVKEGDAELICTVGDDGRQRYRIRLSQIDRSGRKTKNFVVTITDERLIGRTGGIVQGMSGSPIIQNGKLVGAVTHVCVNL